MFVERRHVSIISSLYTLLHVLIAKILVAEGVTFNRWRRNYASPSLLKKLRYGDAGSFSFGRYQSPDAIDKAMSGCRSSSSFKHHSAKDGRDGFYCSTRLGGDWVLAVVALDMSIDFCDVNLIYNIHGSISPHRLLYPFHSCGQPPGQNSNHPRTSAV